MTGNNGKMENAAGMETSAAEKRRKLSERFEFRNIRPEEAEEAAEIEEICFPPNEACPRDMMLERAARVPELFLVAVDKSSGRIAGLLNGIATDEERFRDAFFTDTGLHDPKGRRVMLLGLDVRPEYRKQGLAGEIMRRYLERERENGRETVILTCLDEKVAMYRHMGYRDEGMSASVWGGEKWHDMSYTLEDIGE